MRYNIDREGRDSLHEIIFYEDASGNKPVLEFIQELRSKNGKDARIRLNKVLEYIKVLETSGTAAGEPYTKHLDGDIYELRPISDRIFFAAAVGGRFVLLHQFHKKQQKTPKREIEQAKRELKDFRERSEKK